MPPSTTGKVWDVYGLNGVVTLALEPEYDKESRPLYAEMSPDEARLLGLKLIRLADKED